MGKSIFTNGDFGAEETRLDVDCAKRDETRDREEENMSQLKVKYEDNYQVAHAVYTHIEDKKKFCLRPFNRFNPAYTEWWIIPSTDWPAYKFGKLCFHRRPCSPDGSLYVGYYVEKGLGQKLQGMPEVSNSLIMKDDWHWHKFVTRAQNGDIDAIACEICEKVHAPIHVLVEAYAFNRAPRLDEERKGPDDAVELVLPPADVNWKLILPGKNELRFVNGAQNISRLVSLIKDNPKLDFYWIDVVVGMRFNYGKSREEGIDAETLWNLLLSHWVPLLLRKE